MKKSNARKVTAGRTRSVTPAAHDLESALLTARAVLARAEQITCEHGCDPGHCTAARVRVILEPLRSLVEARA
jgi:hypothetical protein